MEMEHKQEITWINGAKFVSILAVMVDHTYRILYENYDIAYASYFSVSLFIILSGMTSYLSNLHHIENVLRGGVHSCRKIVSAYCIAVAVCMITMTHGFDFSEYISYLVNFNINLPHYFVLLYIQLMIVNGFLFNLLQKCPKSIKGYFYEMLITVCIIALSVWTTNHTNILNVYGGGGKLFGGPYLVLYYFGMLVMRHGWLENTTFVKGIISLSVSGILWFIVWRYTCANGLKLDAYVPFGSGYFPGIPGITEMTFALCMLFITFGMFTLLEQIKCIKKVILFVCEIGRHSLYIFLYHVLILHYFLLKYMPSLPAKNIWLARVVFFTAMIAGTIFIEMVVGCIQKSVKWVLDRKTGEIYSNT